MVGGVAVPVGGVWRGRLPDRGAVAAAGGMAAEVLADVPHGMRGAALEGRLGRAVTALRVGDLVGAARELGGAGPGLTPAGDDVLAGVLLGARARWGAAVQPMLEAAAAAARTHEIAAAFLAWAARGQSIAPAHDLLGALASGDGPAAERALGALLRWGATSGGDLALGLRLGLCELAAPRIAVLASG